MAIDGETLRRSFDEATARTPLHLIGTWVVSENPNIGSVAVGSGSTEITDIPGVLRLIKLSGVTVTVDAMGCQADIAEGDDYILAVKKNQPTLLQGIEVSVRMDRPPPGSTRI